MSDNGSRQILAHVPDDVQKNISSLFKKMDKGKEFEFIFFSKKGHHMNKEKYVLLAKYMRGMGKTNKFKVVTAQKTLDISYTPQIGKSYRVSIDDLEEINKLLTRITDIQNKNYIIYKFLLHTMIKDKNSPLHFMLKTRNEDDTIDIEDLNMRVRLSSETDIINTLRSNKPLGDDIIDKLLKSSTSLDINSRRIMNSSITYRLKERTSMFVEDDDDHFIRIDLTDTKTTHDISRLNTTTSNYELEIEYGVSDSKKVKKEHLDVMYATSEKLVKILQQSSFILGNTQTQNVLQFYREMVNADPNITTLVARQAVSLEIQFVTEILPNRYAVTDKADGDRYFLIIYKNAIYLISNNLNVKDTGIVLDKSLDKYNGTIMDGEYIYLSKEKRHLFMAFDCLRNGSQDLRHIINLMERLNNADQIIADCFVFKGQTGFKYKDVPAQKDIFNVEEVSKFYGQELARFYTVLNKDILQVKEYPLIRRKFFMPVFGAQRWEIFKYSVEYWSRYSEDASVKFPYLLDGLIYHPLEQSYVTNPTESKYHEYKWKPPTKNSVDFYIEFKKDPQTGKIMKVYDNSLSSDDMNSEDTVRNKTYRICTLFVGKTMKGKEYPVPFDKNYDVSEAYIYEKDGEIHDSLGDIITDKTVVEFYYQNDMNIIPQQRWIPIKIRFDKTESVEKHGRRYGNHQATAERVWRSIINPVLMDDFIELAKGNNDKRNSYDIKIKEMNSKVSHQLIVATTKENKYYQKVSKIASVMRQYHNFIKSNLIYTYCNKMYQSNQQQSVLDIGFGRGGDIAKYYYTEVAYLVGIDLDAEGFKSPVDGAISRYNRFRKNKPNFPKMYFIQADARGLLQYDAQLKILSGMDEINKKLLEKFFPSDPSKNTSLFDRISCQFAMHYFLKDQLSWDNFKQNLKTHLRNGGYFVATTFDARQVVNAIGDKDSFTVYYDDSDGNKKIFFDIRKKYEEPQKDQPIGIGQSIELYASWMFDEGNYFTEYLVDIDFIKNDFEKDADLELIDTDLFANQLQIHKSFLLNAAKFESSKETREYMANVAEYYEDNEMNQKCRLYSDLHRYFIFRKKSPADKLLADKAATNETKQIKKQKGGNLSGTNNNKYNNNKYNQEYDFSDVKKFTIPSMENYNDRYSMVNSIHKVLVSHGMFPKSLKPNDFLHDNNLKIKEDHDVSDEYLKEITSKIIINHSIEDHGKEKIKNVLNGLNIFIVERDCNNFYDISYSIKDKYKETDRAIILMKEGGLYKPLMKNENTNVKGIFKMSDPIIEYLLENGDKI